MPVFTVIVTELTREVWTREIEANSREDAWDIVDQFERPWDDTEDSGWVFDEDQSGLDEVTVDVE